MRINKLSFVKFLVLFLTFFSILQGVSAQSGFDKWNFSETPHGLRTVYMDRKGLVNNKYCVIRMAFFSTATDRPGVRGPIQLKMTVGGVSGLKGFAFDDFEGPGAEIGSKELMHIHLDSYKDKVRVASMNYKASLSGWYSEDLKDGFTFSPNTNRKNDNNLKLLVGRIQENNGTLIITISDNKSSSKIKPIFPLYGIHQLFKRLL